MRGLDQNSINEIHSILLRWFEEKEKKPADVMGFITAVWVGQMCLCKFDEEFVDATLKRMKESWIHHPFNKKV